MFVIHWNAPDRATEAVESLRSSEGVEIALTVIDNPSERPWTSDASPEVDVLRLERNIGFAGAANRAVALAREAGAPTFVIAAHDILVLPDTLSELQACLRADPTVGAVAPILMNEEWAEVAGTGGDWLGREPTVADTREAPGRFFERSWLHGCLLLIRTECAVEIGGFWTELFAYCEDVDFCNRARDAGWRTGVWSRALARERGTTASTDRKVYLITRNTLAITRRRGGTVDFVAKSGWIGYSAARAFAGRLAPWRTPARRAASDHYLRGQAWGLIDGLRGRLGPGREFSTSNGRRP